MLTAGEVLDTYYLDVRCMLLEIAATLDRLDLAAESDGDDGLDADERLQRLYDSLDLLAQRKTTPDRAERLLNLFSELDEA
jgi:hypothetical protein